MGNPSSARPSNVETFLKWPAVPKARSAFYDDRFRSRSCSVAECCFPLRLLSRQFCYLRPVPNRDPPIVRSETANRRRLKISMSRDLVEPSKPAPRSIRDDSLQLHVSFHRRISVIYLYVSFCKKRKI